VAIDVQRVHSILVIKLRAIGDVLLSTVVAKNLRRAFPDARIDYLTEPPSNEILKNNPHINSTLIYDRSAMTGIDLIRLVRRRKYDLVIDLFGNPRTALVTRLSGAMFRVGYRFRWRTYAYNMVVEPRGAEVHNTQFNLDALEVIGVDIQDRNLYFHLTSDDEKFVEEFISRFPLHGKLLVGLNAGGGWYTKRWGLDRFAALGDRLVQEFGADIVLMWGPGQREEVEKVQSLMKSHALIPPATTLTQLGALLKRCSLVVSNDSGPMHIAAAVGTPIVGIYGPTNPQLQGPYGDKHVVVRNEAVPCLGCNYTQCPIEHPCMRELDVEAVFRGVETLMRRNKISPERRPA
jgi:heptosyltransferase-3